MKGEFLSKAQALDIMNGTDARGYRNEFSCIWLTANRENYKRKQRLIAQQLKHEKDSEDWKRLDVVIQGINTGGQIVKGDRLQLSKVRGIHAKKLNAQPVITVPDPDVKKKNPNHWVNRTRNVVFVLSNQFRKLHISLIYSVNNKPTLY